MGWHTDIRQAVKQVTRRPRHTVGVVACLALGLATTVGTFSAITSLLDGDQPGIVNRSRLARLELAYDLAATTGGPGRVTRQPWSTRDFAVLETAGLPPALAGVAAEGRRPVTIVGPNGATSSMVAFVSEGYFRTLGTHAQIGRLLGEEDRAADTVSVVVSDDFWRASLGTRPGVVGTPLQIASRQFLVVGVAPARFSGLHLLQPGQGVQGVRLWVPLRHAPALVGRVPDDEPWLTVRGRLAGEAEAADAEHQLAATAARLVASSPSTRAATALSVRAGMLALAESTAEVVVLIGLVLLLPMTVLLIGCLNVASLQLARASERARELAVRVSLGATRGQLIRMLTLETAARTAVAVATAVVALQLMFAALSRALPVALALDWRAVALSLSLLLLVAFVTGLLPAWLVLRRAALSPLKQSTQGGNTGHSRLRSALVATQVAVSLMLLSHAVVSLRSFNGVLMAVPATFTEQLVARFDLTPVAPTPAEARRLADELADRLSADPRISAVALSRTRGVRYEDSGTARRVARVEMTPSYLRVMDLSLLAGRALTAADDGSVVLASAGLATTLSPGGSAVGRVLTIDDDDRGARRVQVVGVVSDIGTEPSTAPPAPVVYALLGRELNGEFALRVRTPATGPVSEDMRNVVRSLDPRITWASLQRGDEIYLEDALTLRYVGWAIGLCGVIALVLAATGLYAVISYAVQLRRREIGVRLAIGADPRDIVRLIAGQAGRLTIAGAAAGLALGLPLNLGFKAVSLVPLTPLDPMAYLPTTIVLFVVGILAAALPARRAARIDPATTLRQD